MSYFKRLAQRSGSFERSRPARAVKTENKVEHSGNAFAEENHTIETAQPAAMVAPLTANPLRIESEPKIIEKNHIVTRVIKNDNNQSHTDNSFLATPAKAIKPTNNVQSLEPTHVTPLPHQAQTKETPSIKEEIINTVQPQIVSDKQRSTAESHQSRMTKTDAISSTTQEKNPRDVPALKNIDPRHVSVLKTIETIVSKETEDISPNERIKTERNSRADLPDEKTTLHHTVNKAPEPEIRTRNRVVETRIERSTGFKTINTHVQNKAQSKIEINIGAIALEIHQQQPVQQIVQQAPVEPAPQKKEKSFPAHRYYLRG